MLLSRVTRMILWFPRIFLEGIHFARANRDLQGNVVRSCVDYWKLAARIRIARSRTHDVNKPVSILGMKVYFLSLDMLGFLLGEIFIKREYAFTPDDDAPLILDCGSNIGMSILFFKKLFPRARIIGFEPDKSTFEILSRNVAENGLTDVSLYNVAVSSRTGEAPFFSDPQHPGSLIMSLQEKRIASDAHQVQCVTLSSFVQGPVGLLKMDIEGAEMGVMQELRDSGTLKSFRAIIMEYHHHIGTEDGLSDMLRLLEDNSFGYDVSAALPAALGRFQDILLRIYRKGNLS